MSSPLPVRSQQGHLLPSSAIVSQGPIQAQSESIGHQEPETSSKGERSSLAQLTCSLRGHWMSPDKTEKQLQSPRDLHVYIQAVFKHELTSVAYLSSLLLPVSIPLDATVWNG